MGWLDDPEVNLPIASANVGAPAPGQWWSKDPVVESNQPRAASGLSESIQAGLQGSAPGLAWRGKLPDLVTGRIGPDGVIDPRLAAWWERAAASFAHVGAELPLMIGGAIAGGAAAAPTGPVGSLLGAGFGMGVVPATIRQSLIEGFKAGEIKTAADWFNAAREVATQALKEGGINAAAMGMGAVAKAGIATLGGANAATAKAIGVGAATPITRAGAIGSETADLATQIATMVAMPAALEQRLPGMQEFIDAAILVGGMKAAHVTATRMMTVYEKTGKTPAEQVEDARADPKVAEELAKGPGADEPWIPSRLPEYTKQEELWSIQGRLGELERKANGTPDSEIKGPEGEPVRIPGEPPAFLTDAERLEREALRTKVAAFEAEGIKPTPPAPEVPRETSPAGPRYAPDQLSEAIDRAKTRLEELSTKSGTEALTDAERAERVLLTNAMGNPEALAKRFGMEPAIRVPTAAEIDASAQRVYEDVLRQATEADAARQAAGSAPLGDEHAQAVAALVRARVRTRAARLGMLPEEIYNERPLRIRDESQQEAAQLEAEAAAAPELPRFVAPEVDLFGDPVAPPTAPRYGVENLATVELPLKDLILSKEVPQFKAAANAEGVIVPLGGRFDRTGVGPIQVWERTDGTLEVISGRHRLDLARRSGEETIPAQIHREAEGFDARQAATLDAQLNIREEQGSVADYAQYFKDAGITKEAADELGLLARAKGRTGFAIARDASPDLLEAHRAGLLSDEAALSISGTAPGSERLQALGIAMINDGKSILYAVNTMRAVDLMAAERMAAGQQGDIFGFDDSAMREAASMAKKASSDQRRISEQISAVNGASKRPEIARKLGVDVQDPEGVQKKIAELREEQYQWDNWPLYPDLVAKLRAADLKQDQLYQTGTLAPSARDWRDAPLDDTEYITRDEYYKALNPYVKDGVVTANSRLVPNENAFPPIGSWRIDTNKFTYGREIEKLVELPIDSLVLGELDSKGRLDPAKAGDEVRYAEWIKSGKRPPPIEVVQTEEGRLSVTDGHRRALAARLAGAKTVEAWVNFAVPVPDGGRYGNRPDGKQIRTGMTYEMLTGEIPNPYLDRMPLSMSFDLKPETPAELKARDEEAAAAAKRKLDQERAGVKGPVLKGDQVDMFANQGTLFQTKTERIVDRVLAKHGEQDSPDPSDPKTRISNETADRLAKEKDPDAGIAALLAFVSDDFTVATRDVRMKRPATRALAEYVKDMPPSRSGELYRVLAFDTEAARMKFLQKIANGAGRALQSERAVMSFTAENPEGAGPMQNVGRDVASQFGEHSVVIQISPSEGKTLNIGRDISFLYKGTFGEGEGVEYLIPRDTQFTLRPIEARNGEPWVTLEPTSGQKDRVLFQSKEDKPWYYSELARQVEALPPARVPADGLTADQWKKLIWEPETTKTVALRDEKNKPTGETKTVTVQGKSNLPNVKQEEIEATGLLDWLATKEGKVTKEQVQAFMEQGGVKVTETVAGGVRPNVDVRENMDGSWSVFDMDTGKPVGVKSDTREGALDEAEALDRTVTDTKFSDYQLPGSVPGSYRELVLTLPPRVPTLPDGYHIEEMAKSASTVANLVDEWNAWLTKHNIPKVSADEIPKADWNRLTEAEQIYTRDYLDRWEEAARTDQKPGIAPKYTLVGPDGSGSVMPSSRTIKEATSAAIQYLQRVGKMPKPQTFESGHFSDAGDYLAHTRVNDRIIPATSDLADVERRLAEAVGAKSVKSIASGAPAVAVRKGLITEAEAADWSRARGMRSGYEDKKGTERKVLFVEEIQSDRAQKGRTEGFSVPEAEKRIAEMVTQYDALTAERRTALMDAEALPGEGGDKFVALLKRADDIAKQLAVLDSEMADLRKAAKGGIAPAPFVTKTDSWTALVLKRLLRYAAEGNYDAIAWTRGEQQVERYTSALRKAVDTIEWKKTPEGVQIVGYKGSEGLRSDAAKWRTAAEAISANDYLGFDSVSEARDAIMEHRNDWMDRWGDIPLRAKEDIQNWVLSIDRSRTKVVDTTEKESALSDAIGKSMADRIIKDPNQTGTIEGENININDTGMAGYYDRIVPKVAEKVAKQVGGGKVGEIELAIPRKNLGNIDIEAEITRGAVPNFDNDPAMLEIFQGSEPFPRGTKQPLFAETKLMVDGQKQDGMVGMDNNGVHIIDADGGNEFLIPKKFYTDAGYDWSTPESARRAVQQTWTGAEPWQAVKHIVGEARVGPYDPAWAEKTTTNKQMALEITPAMREKIMAGQALFQKPGQERDGQHLASYSIAENLITTFQNANKSSVIHELSHSWLEEMRADAQRPNAPAQIKADWEIIRQEFAIGETGDISTASHEQFARTGERYFGEGVAPSVGLRAVFERFKAWMLEVYGNIQNLGVTINPEVRGVFDRMIATDQEIADAKALDVPRAYVPEARRAEAEKIVPPAPEGRKIEPGFEAEQASMQPYADELPKGPGEAPDSSHVNYAYINSPMDVKLAMQRMAEIDQANIQRQRGGTEGVKSWAEANAEQARYVNDILGGSEDTLRLLQPRDPNAAGPDVKLGILKKLAVGAAKDSARLRDVVLAAGHDATVRQQLEYMGSIERARMIQAEFLGERAGVARALNALKDVTEGSGEIARMLDAIGYGAEAARELFQTARTPAEEQAYLKAQLDEIMQRYRGKTPLDIAKLHKEIGTLKGTFKMAKDVEKATTWEMLVEGWRAGLLSGPVTHTTNLFGTGAFQALRAPVDALAAVIGMARGASPGMGESDRASMSEAIGRITGMLGGLQDGIKVGYHTFMADQTTGKTESYREAIPGRAGEIIRIPLRLMGAEDALVSTMYLRGELRTLAIRQAFNEHMNPGTREFATRVDELMNHPTPEIQLQAEQAATRMTFNMPLGEKGVALQLFVQKWNLQWMIPFIRTPINIAKELLRMSPFAPAVAEWRQAMAKGGVERDRALAEIALGTGITALTMAYAFSGDITGGPSPDPGKNRAKAGVWQPYSIKIGDTWYEYARIQPTGTLMGMAADIAAVWDHMNDEEKDKLPKMLAAAFAQAITNQTFLQGITNFVNAMSDPKRFGPRFLQQFAGSMVPNVIGQPTTMADPVVREVNGMLEAIQARIPGFRQQLLPKRDWLGEPVKTKERTALVMPVREQPISEDKVRLEADRLGLSVAAAPKKTHLGKGTGKLGDVEFTPEERDKFEQAAGQMAHPILTNIVNAPGYDAIPDLIKLKIFRNVLTASHKFAAAMALPVDKKLAYIQQITERVQQELQPAAE